MIVSGLKLYFEMGGVLFAAWAVFVLCRKVPVPQKFMLRLAQALVACALVLPALMHAIPERQMPVVKFEVFTGHELARYARAPQRQVAKIPHIERDRIGSIKQSVDDFSRSPSGFSLALLLLLALGIGWFAFAWHLRQQFLRLSALLSRAARIREVGRVRVAISDEIRIPFSALMHGKAYVVVPFDMITEPDDMKLAIFHELQHHRTKDTLWARFIEVMKVVFFWNPAVYLWKKEIIQVQELACDEALIGQRRVSLQQYGRCLLKVAEAALVSHQVQIGTVCMAVISKNKNRHVSFLRRRIDMFPSHTSSKRKRALGLALGTLAVISTAAVAYGAQQTLKTSQPSAPNPGQISFDPAIQKMTEESLAKYVKKFKAKAGFVVISDTVSGRVLAVANISQDPKASPNWALSAEIEPASAMKVPLVATALDQVVTTPDEMHDCADGVLTIGHGTYHDWKPFHELTTSDTVVNSSNLCSIRIAQELGADGVAKSMSDFGFGIGGTTSGFPQARPGEIPDLSRYQAEDAYATIAVGVSGQTNLHITPLEMVQAFGAIANKGRLMKPIAHDAPDTSVEVLKQAISERTASEMKSILRRVVTDGTGQPARSKLYTTAGKTSSAYSPSHKDHELTGGERAMGGFAGFAPVTNPRIAVYVGMLDPDEAPDHNPHGARHAAPVFKEVIEKVLPYLGVAPDNVK